MEKYNFKTQGVCSQNILIAVDNGVIHELQFLGGCPGNLAAISKLVKGRPMHEVAETLKGITCGGKSTSCSDQLAKALEAIAQKEK